MKVNVVYLPHRRFHYADVFVKILNKIKYKDLIHITVCGTNHHDHECDFIVDELKNIGISSSSFIITTSWTNYIEKLRGAVVLDYKYTIKIDEDIFLNPGTWNFFLENLDVLEDPQNGLLAPILSNGIPSVDNFIYKHFDPKSKQEIYDIFSKTTIPNLWGADYSALDNLLKSRGYESDSYYKQVDSLKHYYKGIHPVRVSGEAQVYINNWIMNNFDKFFQDVHYSIQGSSRPYICNSVFAIKSDDYHNILHDQSLFRDTFDEVAVNNFLKKHNKIKLFISNNFGIHSMYNTIYNEITPHKREFYNQKEEELFQFIKQQVHLRL